MGRPLPAASAPPADRTALLHAAHLFCLFAHVLKLDKLHADAFTHRPTANYLMLPAPAATKTTLTVLRSTVLRATYHGTWTATIHPIQTPLSRSCARRAAVFLDKE